MSGVRGFCEYIQRQKPYILVSFRQNISFKQRTELTNGHRAEKKSQEKQGFHLDTGQFVGTLVCTSAVKLSCRENDGESGSRTLVISAPDSCQLQRNIIQGKSDCSHYSKQWLYLNNNQTAGTNTFFYKRDSNLLANGLLYVSYIVISISTPISF